MGNYVAVARAAHLLGVNRQDLQRMIRKGELHTFEGQVDLDELRECYPLMALNRSSMLERVEHIKETAFGRRVQQRVVPDIDDLESRLRRKTAELDIARAEAGRYRDILEELAYILRSQQLDGAAVERAASRRLCLWLAERLDR